MKTTIEIDDKLLEAAERCAKAEGVTLDALFEDAVRAKLNRRDLEPDAWTSPVTRDVIYEETYWKTLEEMADANRRLEQRSTGS